MPHQIERYGHGYPHHYSLELAEQLVTTFFQTLDKTGNGISRNQRPDRHDAQPSGPCCRKRNVTPAADRPQATGQAAETDNRRPGSSCVVGPHHTVLVVRLAHRSA